jgi:hypothetical protein
LPGDDAGRDDLVELYADDGKVTAMKAYWSADSVRSFSV